MNNGKIEQLKNFFEGKKWIKLAFLFGSQSKGRQMAESDFDIGVWPEQGAEKKIDSLWLELERLLKRPVDIIELPTARPTIAWEAFRGVPLSVKDEHFYLDRMVEVSSEAEDFQDLVAEIWNAREGKR